ncbi:zinc-binding protein A33-like [Protopterus annectens]|uniref:zinc-binding protein A33-like n=1 Tax=Protopterus annectens TaxID=7888 RepID=UPI001CF96183|nr:zinc-binding protein A33-like [Protopterus annectens]
MKENLQKIEEKTETIQKQISDIQSKLQQEDPLLFLTGIKNEIERTMKGQEKEDRIHVELVSENLSPGVYKGPLQYCLWKKMLSVVNPELVTLKQEVEQLQYQLVTEFTETKNVQRLQQLQDSLLKEEEKL